MAGIDPARLYHQLLNTGLQNKDNPLYQVVYELIGQVIKLTAASSGSSSGGGGTTIINQNTILQILEGDSEGGSGGDMGPPGIPGIDSANGMVPYFIAPTETFIIPIYKQALFAMTIDMEGMIDVEGFLIEVDGIEELPAQQFLGPIPEDNCCGDNDFPIPGPRGLQGDAGINGFNGFDGLDGEDSPIIPGLKGDKGDKGDSTAFLDDFFIEDIVPVPVPHGYNHINGADPIYDEFTTTTTGNIDDLDFANATLIRMNNATDATIRGLKAGIHGQIVIIASIGAGNVYTLHQNANSAAANRLLNYITVGNTPLSTGKGSIIYQYDATTARWRAISHNQGDWISVPYSAGDFTGNGAMTWTVAAGDVNNYSFLIIGNSMWVELDLRTTTVGGTPNSQLQVTPPAGYTILATTAILVFVSDNAVAAIGRMLFSATFIQFRATIGSANWTASTDNTNVSGVLQLKVV